MALPTSTNDVTARKLGSVINSLWTKIKSTFVKKTGDTMTGRLTLEKPLSQVIIGTGTAGSSSSGTYYPAKWKYDLGIANPTQGDQIVIKLPCAGSDYGCFISTDNGTTYYPVARHVGANRHTTQYGNGSYICVVFEAYVDGNSNAGQVNDIYPAAGGTARTSLKIGCWRIINDYDSGNTICQLRTENGRFYAGSTGCTPYSLVCLDKAGKYSMLISSGSGTGTSKTINTVGKFKLDAVILYYNHNSTAAANAIVPNTYQTFYAYHALDTRYSHNHTTTFATNSPLYIECTIDSDGYWSPTTKCITQTLEAGKYYIYLGLTYSTEYQLSLFPSHPLYYYDGTNLTERPRLNNDDRIKLDGISAGANKVEASSTNGKIKIDGTDTTVYTHPTQTAYSAKGSATKVPKITTDSTGHVTSIEEVTISGVTPASHTHGNIANGGTLTDTAAAAAGNDYVVIRDADNAKIQTSTIKGTDVADAVSKKHSHSTLTLSTTAQAYDGTNTLALPSSDPYTSARTPTSHTHGNIANGGTLTDTAAAAAGNDYVVIRDADNAKIQTSTIKGTDVADAVSKKHSHSTLTLSTTAQAYDGSHTLALPSTDPYTSARTPTSHTHGNIANGGTLTDTAAAAAGNDYVVIRDADNSKIQTSTIKGTDVADAVSKKHSHSTLTLSTTAQAYDGSHTLALPSTDPYTSARTPTSHTHGNITNGGALQTNDITIANGDKLVVTDSSDSNKVARASISFDGSTTTTALTPKGTFEAFAKSGDITTAINNLDSNKTSTDGTNVQVKVTEADGKISAVNITTDTTANKNEGVYYVAGTTSYAAWAANTTYAVNDEVTSSGKAYYCKTAHTSGTSFDSSKWTAIVTPILKGTVSGVTALYTGMKIAYKWPITGGSSSTYLNINDLGNKYIRRNDSNITTHLPANAVSFLTYDGTYWRWADYDANNNTQYIVPDAYCSTAAGTAAKTATCEGFNYSRHNNIAFRIYFTAANTFAGQLTLNLNSQGAKNLWINGTNSSSSNYTIAIGVYWCYYDGTQFQLWTDKTLWALKYRGDGSNITEAFTAASSRSNIATGESNATIFGKIAKWFSDLKGAAFMDTGTASGTVATGNHTHTTSITSDSSSGTIVTLAHDTQYKLTAGGTSILFKTPADSNTDTKVTQTKDDSGTTAYPLLMAGATDPNGTATTARYDSGVKLTPSTNTISANISGNAATASAAQTGSALETAINGKSPTSHTHSVKINGAEKTIAATGGTAVNLGTYTEFAHVSNTAVIGNNSPAADCKTYFANNVSNGSCKVVYCKNGEEYTIIFSKQSGGAYGNIIKYGYADKYIYILRYKNSVWQSEDWEKISAGYADTAEKLSATFLDNTKNLNDYKGSSQGDILLYRWASNSVPTNAPESAASAVMQVINKLNTSYVEQFVYVAAMNGVYQRACNNGTWTSWRKILFSDDVTSTYSSTGTAPVNGTAVAAAIGGLDVSSVGGDGKYISAISETDGKISATATTMDTTPTASSTKAVTSGGVNTALNGKKNFKYAKIYAVTAYNASSARYFLLAERETTYTGNWQDTSEFKLTAYPGSIPKYMVFRLSFSGTKTTCSTPKVYELYSGNLSSDERKVIEVRYTTSVIESTSITVHTYIYIDRNYLQSQWTSFQLEPMSIGTGDRSNNIDNGLTCWSYKTAETYVTSLSGTTVAHSSESILVNISGNAATATKATQDSDGNAINETYFKSSGNVTLVSGTATKIGTQNGTDVKLTLPTIPAAANNGALQLQLNGGTATSKFTANQSGNSTLAFSTGSTAGTFKVDTTEIAIAGFTKVEASSTNGNIKINGTETTVYTHPTTAGNKHIPSGGSSGQFLGYDSAGTAKWVSNPNTDTKQRIVASDSKTYLTGVTTAPTSSNQDLTGVANTNVYATAGQLHATTFDVNSKCTLQFNTTTNALDFVFN